MGAITTTLNLNGNMGNRLAALQRRAEMLYASMQKLGTLNVSPPQSFVTYTTPLQQSVASAVGTVRTLRQSMLDLNKAVAGTRGACAEAAKGIRNISNSAQEANRRVSSLATNLNRLNRVRLPNLNTLPNNSAYAVLGNMVQSLMSSLNRVNSSLARTNSALNSFGSSANRANNALSGTGGASASASRGIRNVGNAAQEAARHTSSLVASLMAAWAVYGTFHAGRSLMETSDKITNIEGRMMVGIDEGSIKEAKAYLQKNMEAVPIGMTLDEAALQGSVAQYKKRIMDIANETRQTFTDTAGFISKLMVNVGGKAFKTTSELLDFTKTLNKFIVVSGASGSEATSILTQLPQALSSGNLQGDELRSIRENAPLLKNVIQDYANKVLGLQGDIKDLGAQGQITARTVVDAVKWGANIADEKLGKMPWTWAQRWNTFSNQVIVALEPVFDKIKQLANMEGTGKMFTDMANVVANLAGGIVKIATVFMALGTALSNIGLLYPIVTAGITAMVAATTMLIAKKVVEITLGAIQLAQEPLLASARMASAVATSIAATIEAVYTTCKEAGIIATIASTAADLAANAAKWLLVAAGFALVGVLMVLSPILLVVGAGMIIYGIATGSATIATWGLYIATAGVVAVVIGLVGVLVAWIARMVAAGQTAHSVAYYIGYLFGWLYGVIYNVIAHIWNVVAGFANFFYNVLDDPVQAWVNLVHDMVDDCISYLQGLASAIDSVFGSNLANAVAGWKSRAQAAVASIIGNKKPMTTIMNRMTYKDVGVVAGEAGRGLEKFTGEVKGKVGAIMDNLNGGYQGYNAAGGTPGKLDGIKGDTGRIAKATEKTAENLDWLITANERRAINSFTNQNYQVPVNVTINGNDRNLAGIAEEIRWNLTDYLTERLSSGAEGAVQGV